MICTMQLIIWRVFQKKVSNRIFRALLACRLFRRNSKPFTNVIYDERSNAFFNSSLKQVNDVSFFSFSATFRLIFLFVSLLEHLEARVRASAYMYIFQKAPLIMFARSKHIIIIILTSHHISQLSRAWDFPEGPINKMKL